MAKAVAQKKVTREAYETALSGYVHNNNQSCTLAAKRDKELEPINEKYDPQFETLRKSMDEQFETVKQYCEENRTEMFVEAKSTEAYGAHVGFREGAEKLIVLPDTDEKAVAVKWLKLKAWVKFLRMTPALDKKAIVKAKPKGLEKFGLKVGREETFFLEPVKTEVPE